MNAQLQQNHFRHEYSADELSEFILQLDEYGLDPELTDDEYHIYSVRTGNLVAFLVKYQLQALLEDGYNAGLGQAKDSNLSFWGGCFCKTHNSRKILILSDSRHAVFSICYLYAYIEGAVLWRIT